MQTYLVGGAVRDLLLGREVTERDWLVAGATADKLRAMGYRQVGKDFPIFLHPQTHEEYALPRRYRKDIGSDPVSIEEDLTRRDLTINALAQGEDGEIIDPCGGQSDLNNRILRHTLAFAEDPIRVLRLARFAARYHAVGFTIAPETEQLVREMVAAGSLNNLVSERVWMEIAKAMTEDSAHIFIKVLHEMGALAKIMPELDRLFGVPQPEKYHPEVDTGLHTLLVLEQACQLSSDPQVRFAALVHDLGKGTTSKEILPSHHGHEERGAKLIKPFSKRLNVPNTWRNLAIIVARYHTHCHRAFELRPKTLLQTMLALDAFRKPQRFEQFLLVCEADVRGRTGLEGRDYSQADYFRAVWHAAMEVDTAAISRSEPEPQRIAAQIQQERRRAIAAVKEEWKTATVIQ
ncbi:CCA tRNA nucleotidyltransferase [hydrothermal vent metagenome]|uniref:CCA tRNA nucleotidyltransferase n=1 Tax=hydrothermal vent metagenome TaxID=652676 RepID=A0A3B1BBI3_9ZZZZ